MYKQLTQLLTAARLISRSQGATIKELEERVCISRRSVYRLIDRLEELGYPLYDEYEGKERIIKLSEERNQLRWWIPLPKVKLTLEDGILLDYLFQEATESPVLAERIAPLRQKMAGLIADGGYSVSESPRKPTILHSAPVGKILTPQAREFVQTLFRSIRENRVCLVTYQALSSDREKTFSIHPLALFDHGGGLYLYVLIPYYGSICTLGVERIKALELIDETFTPPESFDAEKRLSDPFGIILDDPFTARIRFSAGQAPYVRERDWPAGSSFEESEDGSVIFTVETAGAYELKRWVLSYGDEAELLEPAFLREDIAGTLARAAAGYNQKNENL